MHLFAESRSAVPEDEGGRKKKGQNDTKQWRYYDNSLIFKVAKERRDRGGGGEAPLPYGPR